MEHLHDKNKPLSETKDSKLKPADAKERKEWATPHLHSEDMSTITESGNFNVSFGDDGFYVS
jgi:hypothetical protein